MKKIILALVFVLCAAVSNAQNGVGIGIFLQDTAGPIVSQIRPLASAGNSNGNISFTFNVSDLSNVSSCSLIINNHTNSTMPNPAKDTTLSFSLSELALGTFNWRINCSDIRGLNGTSGLRYFTVNKMARFNGSTTNLSNVNMSNVSLVLEILPYGKMSFSSVDLSGGYDIDSYAEVWTNRISITPENLLSLNTTSLLSIYGLSLSNPRILRNNATCPSTTCTINSYGGGTLNFQVTGFSTYSAEETPQETPAPSSGGSGGGGGGGGRAFELIEDFEVDKNTLKIILKQGQTKREKITIKNTGDTIIEMKADLGQIEKFKISPDSNFIYATLNPQEEYTIELTLKATEKDTPDLYPAKIIFSSPNKVRELITLIEVESADPLFDVDVEVLPQSKNILPGKEILFEVNLFNVRSVGRVDVFVDYVIKDLEGNTVAMEQETLAVETQARFTRSVLAPSDLKPGTYVAFVKISYGDATALSSDLFEIAAKEIRLYPIKLAASRPVVAAIGSILVAGLLAFVLIQYRKVPISNPESKLMEEQKILKMHNELKAIEDAYKSKFISEETYSKEKKRITEKMNMPKT